MNIMANESQFELFSHSAASSSASVGRPHYLKPKVILTYDNLIIASIALLLLLVLSFAVGVERGKSIVRLEHRTIEVPQRKTSVAAAHPERPKASTIPVTSSTSSPAPVQEIKKSPVLVPETLPVLEVAAKQPEAVPMHGVYTVQVASFKQEKYARQEAMNLKQKGYDIAVVAKGKHSIVCVGKFAQKQEAVAMSSKLRKYYKDCVVRNL